MTLAAALLLAFAAERPLPAQPLAQQFVTLQDSTVCGLPVSAVTLKRDAALMSVRMTLGLGAFGMHGDRATVFTPVLVNGSDSLELDPVGVYGRLRHIQYLRSGEQALGGDAETSYKYSERPAALKYERTVPYEDWMNGATLGMRRADYGCCRTLLDEQYAALADWEERDYRPVFHYVRPTAEALKIRELSGRAFIDFPVNRTEIHPDYRSNPAELAKIIATIDSVRNDRDITVKKITIKGYASPEGSYENNIRLAKGRTAALKQYVRNLYRFDEDFIGTDYEPEDWEGLREFVAGSGLAHREEILALIDSDMAPDPKNDKLRETWPDEYQFLLQTVYPALRHSDYTIEYTIRQFSSVDEIRAVMASAPQKLSLNEMYVLAQSLEPGSDEYNEVFETAVRMYPEDETANLNAAHAAIQRGDLNGAGRYLARAGKGAEAVYARGVLAALEGDYERAQELLDAAAEAGLADVSGIRERVKNATEK